jgi:hypothetical protein
MSFTSAFRWMEYRVDQQSESDDSGRWNTHRTPSVGADTIGA